MMEHGDRGRDGDAGGQAALGLASDSLSDAHKDLVKSAALEAAQYTRDLGAKFDAELLEKLKSEGKNEVNEIDLAAFQAASDPIYAAVSELAGEDLVKRMRSAAE